MLTQQTDKIKKFFNRAEQSYDHHAYLQHATAINLIHLLKKNIGVANSIIDLGCGTGFNTYHLAKSFDYKEFYAVDIANLFLVKAKKYLESHKIHFLEINFDNLEIIDKKFDIIYSNMALHWSNNFTQTLNKALSLLNPNGILAFSIPLIGTLAEFNSYYAKNNFFDSDCILNEITDDNYQLLVNQSDTYTLFYPDTTQALKSIKEIGANYVSSRPHKGLRGKSFLHKMQIEKLSYVIGYFLIKKNG